MASIMHPPEIAQSIATNIKPNKEDVFSTTKDEWFLTERHCLMKKVQGLMQEFGAREKHIRKNTWAEYSQFVLIIRDLVLSIRIFKAEVG